MDLVISIMVPSNESEHFGAFFEYEVINMDSHQSSKPIGRLRISYLKLIY